MRKITTYITAALVALAATSCEHKMLYTVDFQVELDQSNSYKAGEAVLFNFKGDADNLTFFSGEDGHQYKNKDRFEFKPADVKSINLDLNYYAYYDVMQKEDDETQLEVYITKDFDGLAGDDFEADSLKMAELYKAGMPGWTKLNYKDDINQLKIYVPYSYSLSTDYVEGLVIAFYFRPRENYPEDTSWRRFYRLYGLVSTEVEGAIPTTVPLHAMSWQTITFNTVEEARYNYVSDKAGVRILSSSSMYSILWDARKYGSSSRVPPSGWCISRPVRMTAAEPDKGMVIKNLQNDLSTYGYVYETPGTYTATFVGVNRNHLGGSQQVKELTITIK